MVLCIQELSQIHYRSDVYTQVIGPQEGPRLPEMQDEDEDDEPDSSDSMAGNETRMPMWSCLTFSNCLFPAPIKSLRTNICLASSDLLHMYLALAGTRFLRHCHHYAVCMARFGSTPHIFDALTPFIITPSLHRPDSAVRIVKC